MARSDFVDWDTYDEHLRIHDMIKDDIGRLDAEVIGDEETGRSSLRKKFMDELQQLEERFVTVTVKESRKNRWAIITGVLMILLTLILKILFHWS